jgi:HEAT repeat protein
MARIPWILALLLLLLPAVGFGKPPSREEFERQQQVLARLREVAASDASEDDKSAVFRRVIAAETDPNLRRQVLSIAVSLGAPSREGLLLAVLAEESDAGVRGEAARLLGKHGSEQSLTLLAQTAASDRTSNVRVGDIQSESSARRAATFALAELGQRLPAARQEVVKVLEALPDVENVQDRESLYDARRQAIYQITRDEKLLAPFYERLASDDPRQRERGVIAFRFLQLKAAPDQLVATLGDGDKDVRSWAALVLGEIGDQRTAKALIATAVDTNEQRGVRANAIAALGKMRAKDATEVLEKLLDDPQWSAAAAVAYYRVTGKKTAQFPAGYNAD